MIAAGVPVTPGYHGDDQSMETLQREADNMGCVERWLPAQGSPTLRWWWWWWWWWSVDR